VESGTCKEVFRHPLHPYTLGLFKSVPRLNEPKGRKLVPIQGAPPSLIDLPPTCAFLPRCTYKIDTCLKEPWPDLQEVKPGHCVRCYVTPEERVLNKDQDHNLLEVRDLKVYFPVMRGLLRKQVAEVKAVDGVTFNVRKVKVLGLVGESGCGKTTVGRSILGLYRPSAGQILFEGQDLAKRSEKAMRETRRKMALIFQDPYSSLDPRQKRRKYCQ